MWLVVHKPTQIVVASAENRREAYDTRRSLRSISKEQYVVVHS